MTTFLIAFAAFCIGNYLGRAECKNCERCSDCCQHDSHFCE